MASINRSTRDAKASRLILVLAIATVVAGVACDDGALPDPGPSSGVAVDTKLVDLSEADGAVLCDWIAGRFGGYGRGVTCADGRGISARQSRALCLMDWQTTKPTCQVTVGELEQCTNGAVGEPRCQTVPAVCSALIACN